MMTGHNATLWNMVAIVGMFLSALAPLTPAAAAQRGPLAYERAVHGTAPEAGSAKATFGRLPISFELNRGQFGRKVCFVARAGGYTIALGVGGMEVALPLSRWTARPLGFRGLAAPFARPESLAPPPVHASLVRIRFVGANAHPSIVGLDRLPGRVNYFIGNNPHRWHTDIPTYARVLYRNVYPGIDLIFYGHNGGIEYDWRVRAGADPRRIVLHVTGAADVRLDGRGNLLLRAGRSLLRQDRPVAYQWRAGVRHPVSATYVLDRRGEVRLRLGAYLRHAPLIVDPGLDNATYLGNSSDLAASAVAVDGNGNVYLAGGGVCYLASCTYGTYTGGGQDAFVEKLDKTETSVVYINFFGGTQDDAARGIAVDASGEAYLAGNTTSPGFPVLHSMQTFNLSTSTPTCGSSCNGDAFITKFNAAGDSMVFSTFLGGSDDDAAMAIALDPGGDAFVTGETRSGDLPTCPSSSPRDPCAAPGTSAYQTGLNGEWNAFVAEISFNAATDTTPSMPYCTYLGAGGYLQSTDGYGIVYDPSTGGVYVTGSTTSSAFPTDRGPSYGGGSDAFLTELSADGTSLMSSQFFGGSGDEEAQGISMNAGGVLYITGYTQSSEIPAEMNSPAGGGDDAFLARYEDGNLESSMFIGGSGSQDAGWGVAVDASGNAVVTGTTYSYNFPAVYPLQPDLAVACSSSECNSDTFVTDVNLPTAAGSGDATVYYSSDLGGHGNDDGTAVAIDPATGDAFVTGSTDSTDFPTCPSAGSPPCYSQSTPAIQSTNPGGTEPFLARISPSHTFVVTTTEDLSTCPNANTYSLRCAINDANAFQAYTTIDFNIPTSGPNADPGCVSTTVQGATVPVCTIKPGSQLPALTADRTIIDATTQGGWRANTLAYPNGDNAILTVKLDGTNSGTTSNGLTISGSNDIVQGLSLIHFGGSAIALASSPPAVPHNNRVLDNFIGLDPDGTVPGSNAVTATGSGIEDTGMNYDQVGDNTAAGANVITGNGAGINAHGDFALTVSGNYIGTEPDGASPPTNGPGNGVGVYLHDGATGADVYGSVIAFNGNSAGGPSGGIVVGSNPQDNTTVHNSLGANDMHDNGTLGIDLASAGPGPNCPPSASPPTPTNSGPNEGVPCPTITGVTPNTATTYTVSGVACPGCTLQVYAATDDADDGGYGEGVQYLGKAQADPQTGQWSAAMTIPTGVSLLTATATARYSIDGGVGYGYDTSEFGRDVVAPIAIGQGWNLLGLPVGGITSFSSLLADLNGESTMSGSCPSSGCFAALAAYAHGHFSVFVAGYSADSAVVASQGIFALSAQKGFWHPSGPVLTAVSPVSLTSGWDLVNVPVPAWGLTGDKIAREISVLGGSVGEIATYNPLGGYTVNIAPFAPMLSLASNRFWLLYAGPAVMWTPS